MIRLFDARIRFITAFVIFLSMWLWLLSPNAISFNFFKVRTFKQNIKIGEHYVRQSLVDNAVVGTTLANIAFGQRIYHTDTTVRGIFSTFEQSRALVNVDILDLLSRSPDPGQALASHIRHVDTTLGAIQTHVAGLRQQAQRYLDDSRTCLAEKTEGDQLFFEGSQNLDQAIAAQGLQMSLESAPCYITNRIQANAYAYLADLVSTYGQVLQRRSTLLTNNQQLLIENRAYFEGNVLEQLSLLKQQLGSLSTTEYESFNGVFNFGIVPNDYNLPTYDRVFFPSNQIPQYQGVQDNPDPFSMDMFFFVFGGGGYVNAQTLHANDTFSDCEIASLQKKNVC